MSDTPHTAAGIRYARDVVAGLIPTGRLARLACQRFLDDLDRARDPDWRWEFRADLAERPLRFASLLPNIKGPEAGKPIRLMGWQAFAFANVFGFVERGTGVRRFRQASIWCPRGSGKTSIAAPLALYGTFLEGEGGAEGYAAAVTRDQAKLLWTTAAEMVRRSPALRAAQGIEVGAHAIFAPRSASKLVAISSDAKALDGLNVHFAILDEIGSHKTSEVYDVVATAMGKRLSPLMVTISTPTGNTAGIGKQLYDYGVKVLDGVHEDDRFFALIYAADEGDDLWSEATWRKANPSWGVSVQPDAIRAFAKQARNNPAREAAFQTRHLGLWVGADQALFSVATWNTRAAPLDLDDYEGRECYVGIDLAARTDLASVAIVFPWRDDEGRPCYDAFVRTYYNERAVQEARIASYPAWAAAGHLIVNDGDETDYGVIEDDVVDLCRRFGVRSVAYDPMGAVQMAQRLQGQNVPVVEFRQTVFNMSEPTKELGSAIIAGRIRHDGNPVTTWGIGNCVGYFDRGDNVRPTKARPDQKIDPAVALIMAIGRAYQTPPPEPKSVYETRGVLTAG